MPPQHAQTSGHEERVMWQVEAPQTDIGPAWNVLLSTPIESSVENAFGDGKLTPPGLNQIQPNSLFCNIFPGSNDIGVQGSPAAQVQSPASLNSSCTTSLSESPTRTSWLPKDLQTQKRETMNNNSVTSAGSHVADDDPEGACPPIGAGGNWWTSLLLSNIQMQSSQSVTGSIPDLDTLNWSSDLPAAGTVGQFPTSMGLPPSTITAHCNQQMGAGTIGMADSSLSVSGVSDNALWGQVFLSGPGSNETVQGLLNCSVEELPDLLYARALRQGNEFVFPDQSKKMEESAPWDLPPKSFTFQGDEMNMAILEKPPPTLQYPQLVDDRLSSTASTLPEMDQWPAARPEHHHTTSVNAFTPGLELPNSAQFDHGRVKQEYPSTSPFWLQGFGADPYKSDAISSQLMEHKPIFKPYAAAANLIASSMVDEYPGRWTPAIHSRIPAALQHALPAGHVARHSPQMIAFSNCFPRLPLDVTSLRPELRQQVHGPATSDRGSPLQYMQQHALEGKPLHDSSSNVRALQGRVEDGGETTSYQKRNAGSVTKSCEHVSEGYFKRPRVEPNVPALPYKQVRKEKVGDRITTLQQLVSPFGKTDTASVLLEAIGYIKFLQEQVQTLSSPYMINASTTPSQNDPGKNSWNAEKSQDTDEPKLDLRSRGLCLVPISCTVHVANDNGADFWTPTYGGNFR